MQGFGGIGSEAERNNSEARDGIPSCRRWGLEPAVMLDPNLDPRAAGSSLWLMLSSPGLPLGDLDPGRPIGAAQIRMLLPRLTGGMACEVLPIIVLLMLGSQQEIQT